MKFRPRNNQVLIQVLSQDQRVRGGRLLMPSSVSRIGGVIGRIVAFGPGGIYDTGERSKQTEDLSVGMKVLVPLEYKEIMWVGDIKDKLTWVVEEQIVAEIQEGKHDLEVDVDDLPAPHVTVEA